MSQTATLVPGVPQLLTWVGASSEHGKAKLLTMPSAVVLIVCRPVTSAGWVGIGEPNVALVDKTPLTADLDNLTTITRLGHGRDKIDGLRQVSVQMDGANETMYVAAYDSATFAQLIDAALAPTANELHVAKSGGQYTTIADALAASVAGNVIRISPGTYAESNPLTRPTGVTIDCPGGHDITKLSCLNPGSDGLILEGTGEVKGLGVIGASGAGPAGFVLKAGSTGNELLQISTTDCDIGIRTDSSSPTNLVRGFTLIDGDATAGVKVPAGTMLGVTDAYVYAASGKTITAAFVATGASALLLLNNSFAARDVSGTPGVLTDGILVEEGGQCNPHGATIQLAVNGIHSGTNGGTIRGTSVDVGFTGSWDILSDSADTDISLGGGRLDSTKISRIDGEDIIGNWAEATPGEGGSAVQGEFRVGSPTAPAEAVIGEGDSTTIDMHVFTTNAAGAGFLDKTADAKSGTNYDVFQGVASGHICYWGVDGREFPGLKLKIATAMVLGAGAIVWEVSDGAAGWNAINIMATNSVAPYGQYAQAAMERVAFDQIRFDPDAVTFGANTVDGQSGHWIRARITTGITTAPVAGNTTGASTKMHTNRWEANGDGFTELFGKAIKKRPIALSGRIALSGGSAPAATTMNPSTNIAWVAAASGYAAAGDGNVWVGQVPTGFDSSRGITAKVEYKPNGTNVAPVTMTFYAVAIRAGDAVPPSGGALAEVNDPVVYTASGVIDIVEGVEVHTLNLPDVVPGETFVFSLQRTTATGGGTPTIETIGDPLIEGFYWS